MSATATIDPVTMQVVGHYLATATNEVEIAMIRSAYSPVIKEGFDCSAGIVAPNSEYWAQADAIPLQTAVLASVHHDMLATFAQPLQPGDVLFTNDPFSGCPHLNDFVSIAPIFAGREIAAYVCTLMHQTDVGGMSAGSMPADATEIYQEGIRIPVSRLFSQGHFNEEILAVILANSRVPKNFRGDLSAQIAATRLGIRRIEEAFERFGTERFLDHVNAFVDYCERRVRMRLEHLREGTYVVRRYVDNSEYDQVHEGLVVEARVTVKDAHVEVDFSGSSPQVARPINVVLSNGIAASMVALRATLGPGLPMNAALQRCLTVKCVEGSIMNPRLPAPVGARALVAALAYDCVLEALGEADPRHASATSSGGTTMPFVWTPAVENGATTRIAVDNSLTGGAGAMADLDGLSAIDNTVTNAMNYPVEMIEQEFPLLIERHELRADSGGPGRQRGGLGLRRVIRFLAPGKLALRGHRHQYPPQGIEGGGAGAPSRFTIVRDGTPFAASPMASSIPTGPGDVLIAETPGGGGFGAPHDRSPEAIEEDIRLGYVTAGHARSAYGYAGRNGGTHEA